MTTDQPPLDGMPEPDSTTGITPAWLYMADVAAHEFAGAKIALDLLAHLPGIPDTWKTLFELAGDRLSRVVMQEIGRLAWEDAYEAAVPRWSACREVAIVKTTQAEFEGRDR